MSAGLDESLLDMYRAAGLSERVLALGEAAEAQCKARFAEIDAIAEYNQMKVLNALREHRIGEAHLSPSTGYGYNDIGRSTPRSSGRRTPWSERSLSAARMR